MYLHLVSNKKFEFEFELLVYPDTLELHNCLFIIPVYVHLF